MTKTPLILLAMLGCEPGDNESPGDGTRQFVIRIDNIASWTVLESGTQGTVPLGPDDTLSITFIGGIGQSISFAAMLGESNDWFFAPGPEGIPLYNDRNLPRSGDVTSQVTLWDAGTEFDQEPGVGDATATNQPSANFGAADPQPGVREVPITGTLDTGATFTRPTAASMIEVRLTHGANQEFTLTIRNCSISTTLETSAGAIPIHISPIAWSVHGVPGPFFSPDTIDRGLGLERIAEEGNPAPLGAELSALTGFATPVSPGAFVVHRDLNPLYTIGQPDYGFGLEQIAEDGNPMPLVTSLSGQLAPARRGSGSFDTPLEAAAPGPAMPGATFELTIVGMPGDRVSFAAMFGMSNDWFFATIPDGIPLFSGSTARSGDITNQIAIYDAGTELDQALAVGPHTATQQPEPNVGDPDPITTVRPAAYDVPVTSHLRVTLTPL